MIEARIITLGKGATMQCQQCGLTIEGDATFCPFCGHKVEQPEAVEQVEAAAAEPLQEAPVAEPSEAPVEEPAAEAVDAAEPAEAVDQTAVSAGEAAAEPSATPIEPMVSPTEVLPEAGTTEPLVGAAAAAPVVGASAEPLVGAAATEPLVGAPTEPLAQPQQPMAFSQTEAMPTELKDQIGTGQMPQAGMTQPFVEAQPTAGAPAGDGLPFNSTLPQADPTAFQQGAQGMPQQNFGAPAGMPMGAPPAPVKQPLSERTWFIVLILLLFWPVGLVLMWRKNCTWPTVAKIIITAVLAVLLAFNIFTLVNNINQINQAQRTIETAQNSSSSSSSSSSSTDSSSSSSSSSNSSSSSSTTPAPSGSWAAECTDSYGNPTMYAALTLNGAEMVQYLEESGYSWNMLLEGWMNDSTGTVWAAAKNIDGEGFDSSEMASLRAGASGTPAFFVYTITGYSTVKDAINGNAQCVVEDSEVEDDIGAAVVYGPNMEEAFVMLQQDSSGLINVVMVNKAGIEAGMVDEVVGEDVGTNIDDVWREFSGRSLP